MGITFISRDSGVNVSIVRLTTTDSTATALGANYITNQATNIGLANNAVGVSPPFQWFSNDAVLLSASDGLSLCSINSTFTSLSAIGPSLPVSSATFTLTAAQFNGMNAAPVQVLAAQGTNTIILPTLITMELIYGSAQFAAGGAVGFQYGNTAALAGVKATNTEQATDFTGATANTVYNFVLATGNGSQLLKSSASNAALYISNATAAFTTGTGASFTGTIYYRTIAVA